MPLLALVLSVNLVLGFDELGIVFLFDDHEAGLEAARFRSAHADLNVGIRRTYE